MTFNGMDYTRITVAIDDPELSSIRVWIGVICEVVDVGRVPIEVEALCKFLEKRYGKPVEEA